MQANTFFVAVSFLQRAIAYHTQAGRMTKAGSAAALTAAGVSFLSARKALTENELREALKALGYALMPAAKDSAGQWAFNAQGAAYPVGSGVVGQSLFVRYLSAMTKPQAKPEAEAKPKAAAKPKAKPQAKAAAKA